MINSPPTKIASPLENISFLIVGLVRDCGYEIQKNINTLESAFKFAKKVNFLIIESDSTDDSVQILSKISSKKENFQYISLGNLSEQYPKRTARIAYCRNYYLRLIDENPEYINFNYVVVADMDGVNNKLNELAVRSCWNKEGWDVCSANQSGPYYDVWALRHKLWSPNDCWQEAAFLLSQGVSNYRAILFSVYRRMIRIPPCSAWIKVQSAFGGLAIYRKEVLRSVFYIGLTAEDEEVCEHVSIHEQITSKGGQIYINPAMINAGVVEHARNATTIGLIGFWMRTHLQDVFRNAWLKLIFKRFWQ